MQVLQEGTATVSLQATNCVTSVTILAESIPIDPLPAGSTCIIPVVLETENGKRPNAEAVERCTVLKMMIPGSRSKSAQVLYHH